MPLLRVEPVLRVERGTAWDDGLIAVRVSGGKLPCGRREACRIPTSTVAQEDRWVEGRGCDAQAAEVCVQEPPSFSGRSLHQVVV